MKNEIVTFNLLLKLAAELKDTDTPIQDAIFYLFSSDVPLSDAVIDLGVAAGIIDEEAFGNNAED